MNKRIRQIIEYYGLSIRAFEQKIFVSESLIYRGLARNSDFSASVIAKILNFCSDISPDWLLLGKGEMLRENCQKAPTKTCSTEVKTQDNLDTVSLQTYEKKVEECALLKAELKALKEQAAQYAAAVGGAYSTTTIPAEV